MLILAKDCLRFRWINQDQSELLGGGLYKI